MESPTFNVQGFYFANSIKDIPTTAHYAVIKFGFEHIPGDARSEEYPGHGYPAHTIVTREYYVFSSKSTWETYLSKENHNDLVAILAHPAKITTHKTIKI